MPFESFGKSKNFADNILAFRKNTKDFLPVTWGSPAPKSSISGDMESVTYKIKENDKKKYDIKDGEELSGMDLIKRNGKNLRKDKIQIPSTSHIASIPFQKYVSSKYSESWKRLEENIKS